MYVRGCTYAHLGERGVSVRISGHLYIYIYIIYIYICRYMDMYIRIYM